METPGTAEHGATELYPAESGLRKVSLRKDVSFSHEKEIRFVVKVSSNEGRVTGINSNPLALKDLNMKVVCHPRMADWKKRNIQQILKDAKLSNAYSESEITLR